MINFITTENDITLSGKLTSENVSEIQHKIENTLCDYNHLNIRLSTLDLIDISGIYMLYLIAKSAESKNKEICLIGLNSVIFQSALKATGIHELFVKNFCCKSRKQKDQAV
ncbi:STAS domain-containing protein [Leeuwenhoekiella sp. MAR_2009_132]|uniref:STAS domain-containing protein n=1 Tax=Leeuwenhoekiella sp. MAR_2009_132 TaxID=1392489 RepID=UPI000490FC3A|nr:STAS domain-containing protein [Leeuwenhoekiella sp. MAR_2009_132]